MAPTPLNLIRTIYDRQAEKHGASTDSVFWKHPEGQALRYEILLGIIEPEDLSGGVTLADLGCGWGAMFDLIKDTPLMESSRYIGCDVSKKMIALAKSRTRDARAEFIVGDDVGGLVDYAFASGTFNMHGGQDLVEWKRQISDSLTQLWSRTQKGLAFNMLDRNHSNKLSGLYYADSGEFLHFCRNVLSEKAELVQGYPLEEWSIFVRR